MPDFGDAVTRPPPCPEFAALFAAEDNHFWFRYRNRVIGNVVRRLAGRLPEGFQVLEVGCGTGNVLRVLEKRCSRGTIVGVDLFAEGLHYARKRTRCHLVQADIHRLPFGTPFHLIGLFDVLEHLEDDRNVLRHLHCALAPGGCLVLTVPAHRSLWSHFDVYANHYRRYEAAELDQALQGVGFRVEYLSQFMLALFPLMWLGRRIEALRQNLSRDGNACDRQLVLDELRVVPGLNGLLLRLLTWEAPLIARRIRLPLGTSLLAIARKDERTPATRLVL